MKDPTQTLTNYTKLLGDLPSGASAHESVQAVIFGEENLQKEITVNLTYSVKGSTGVFVKTQTYDVLINSAPINLTVNSFKETTSGQDFDMKVDVKSNSQDTLKKVLLKADYPFGYSFISSSIPAMSDNTTWNIGDIPAGGDRVITIHGKLTGEDSALKAFHFHVGTASAGNPKAIGTQYLAVENDVTIQKPFITLGVVIDSDQSASDHTGQYGSLEHVVINWSNNLPDTVSNMVIDVKLSGTAYDKTTVSPDAGFFNSGADDITWNQQTNKDLASVAAGASGSVSFDITPRDTGSSASPTVNPGIAIVANVSGNRTQESGVPESLASAITKNIHIASSVAHSGRLVRTTGPFASSGPVPPKADQITTYTVIWDVDNTSSAVGNALVTAALPTYVKWLSNVSPSSEDVAYDAKTGQVTWNVGNISANSSSVSHRREVSFQIAFKPSVSQAGQSPNLVNQAHLTAKDNFTGNDLTSDQDPLTTRFSTDPGYRGGDEMVTR